MERTVLIANTSNMPVAAREASIYTGITIAEYYRDMGYDVALMADSTSRWAEALREISGRLEEMPGEEGFPAYLAARLAEFYERAGRVTTLGGDDGLGLGHRRGLAAGRRLLRAGHAEHAAHRPGLLGAGREARASAGTSRPSTGSPPTRCTPDTLDGWYRTERGARVELPRVATWAMELLQKEAELQEIVQLVGSDALPETSRQLTLEVARMIREVFLQQNAYHPVDTYCPMTKQYAMLKAIKTLRRPGQRRRWRPSVPLDADHRDHGQERPGSPRSKFDGERASQDARRRS